MNSRLKLSKARPRANRVTIFALLLLWSSHSFGQEKSQADTELEPVATPSSLEALDDLARSLSSAKSLHLRSKTLLNFRAEELAGITDVQFEFWSEGQKYRATSLSDQASQEVGILGTTDFSFDGVVALSHWPNLDEITVNDSRHQELVLSAPNPLELLFEFLRASPSQGDRSTIHLPELYSSFLTTVGTMVFSVENQEWEVGKTKQVRKGSQDSMHVRFAGIDQMGEEGGESLLPSMLKRVLPDGSSMTIEYRDYEPFSEGVLFPRSISLRIKDSEGKAVVMSETIVVELSMNEPVDPRVFRLEIPEGNRLYYQKEDRHIDALPPVPW